jgi:hypothetical protein
MSELMSFNQFHEQTGEGLKGFSMYLLANIVELRGDEMTTRELAENKAKLAAYEESRDV